MLTRIKNTLAVTSVFAAALLCIEGCAVDGSDSEGESSYSDSNADSLSGGATQSGASFRVWTGYTSEEYPPIECNSPAFVRGLDCQGSYCDNIRIDCHNAGVVHGAASWTTFFSEEATSWRLCAWNEFMTGLQCKDRYCDMIAMECTDAIGKMQGSCSWSGWYSEEDGPFQAPAGRFVTGIQCYGSYCDLKSYRHCTMVNR